MEQVVFYSMPLEKLLDEFRKIVAEALDEKAKAAGEPLFGRKEVSEKFGVSLVTLHRWTSLGLIQCHRVGGRIYYKQEAVEKALKAIKKYDQNKQYAKG